MTTMETAIFPALIAFVMALICCPILIPMLSRLKFGQYIREEGPKSHQKKAGTPTLGGIAIILCMVVGCVFFCRAVSPGTAGASGDGWFWPGGLY